MATQVKQVYGNDNSMSPKLFQFEHAGPSRSGFATISVFVAPADGGFGVNYMVTYAHHEGTESYYPGQWDQHVNTYRTMLAEMTVTELMPYDEYTHEDCVNILSIAEIVASIVNAE